MNFESIFRYERELFSDMIQNILRHRGIWYSHRVSRSEEVRPGRVKPFRVTQCSGFLSFDKRFLTNLFIFLPLTLEKANITNYKMN